VTLFDPEVPDPGVPASPPGVRLRLLVAYDGRAFRGFAAQPGQRTVAGALADALGKVLGCPPPPLVGAGRTDAGVHAVGQVVHVDLPAGARVVAEDGGLEQLRRRLCRLLQPDLVVRELTGAAPGFDARRSALWRRYRYLVHEADQPDPRLAGLVWSVPGPLAERAMAQAADVLVGRHDFRAFCRRPPGHPGDAPIERRVLASSVRVVPAGAGLLPGWGRLLQVELVAEAFCHQMVRSVVALLVAVGQRRRSLAEVHQALLAGTRQGLPAPAPPGGLTLMEVGYPSDQPGGRAVPAGQPAPARVVGEGPLKL
jgi:tRNA pseudouridine38-40 synthase